MEKIGDFGEVLVDKAPERDICAFGEDCTGVASTPNQRRATRWRREGPGAAHLCLWRRVSAAEIKSFRQKRFIGRMRYTIHA